MYTTIRYYFPHGDEFEAMECTVKEWSSLEKAIAYCHRYSKGVRFASVEIKNERGEQIYELLSNDLWVVIKWNGNNEFARNIKINFWQTQHNMLL